MDIKGTDLFMIRGDSESIRIQCLDENEEMRPFVPGDTVTMTVARPGDGSFVIQKKVTAFSEDGAAEVVLYPEDTADLMAGPYRYDVQLDGADGTVKTIIRPSLFEIGGDVTRG